jgi:secreted PhoX family phosphatase
LSANLAPADSVGFSLAAVKTLPKGSSAFNNNSTMSSFVNSRRQFLQFITNQSALLALSPSLLTGLSSCTHSSEPRLFESLSPSKEDDLRLASGLQASIIRRWGDPINKAGETFGFNNDFTSYMPLEDKVDEGLLWVNHESVLPEFIHNKDTHRLTRSINEVVKEQESVGGSILHLQQRNNQWSMVEGSPYNRRIHGRTPIAFSHGFKIQGSRKAIGTIANCAGGQTPWRTFLTSEENYDDFYGEAFLVNGKRTTLMKDRFNWWKRFNLPPEHYGWIVEIDPLTGKAEKQVLLGRAPHEGATVATTQDNRAVVYMGEDREGGFIFKFVSDGLHFKSGTLYAADTLNGRWLPLDIKTSPALQKNFKTQLDVLTYAHQSAEVVGATPQDRPEDIEIHKTTGDIFIALTKNTKNGNLYGSLLKISEDRDFGSTEFKASTWISGGLKSGLACPDNLCFDRRGNLWVTTDISEKDMTKKEYAPFGNNGLYYIPMSGPAAGQAHLVATAPTEAELTGPWFTPDYQTLFLSVQHPGSGTRSHLAQPTSQWPDGPGQLPKSSVVAIQGPLFQELMG